ncbi:MAG: hypothetical protein LUE14_09880, partial [Clostridiales bacterium]|nr:hypothetical protein [Clostridiales bacterium]
MEEKGISGDYGELIVYQTADGNTRLDVKLEDETVWLTQMQMAELFHTSKQNISLHINNSNFPYQKWDRTLINQY